MLLRSAAVALALCAGRLAGQEPGGSVAPGAPADSTARVPAPAAPAAPTRAVPDSTARTSAPPPRGAEFLVPLGSFVLPGLGQYVYRAPAAGIAYTAATVGGYGLGRVGDAEGNSWNGDVPLRPRDQLAEQAEHVAVTAGMLSAWDAFHRGVPALQRRGKYDFLRGRERPADLLSAPFDPRFLRRWTTWVDLAQTAAITALVLSERRPGVRYRSFRAHDGAYATALAANAAVGEEALFRGWLLPLAYERTGRRFWLGNGLQAGLFGAAHLPGAGWGAAYVGAWAAWEGWVVRRNRWSVRESIFHHFWYDAAVVSATFLTAARGDAATRVAFPTIRF